MLVTCVVLALLGDVAHVPLLATIGALLVLIGLVMFLLGRMGRPVDARRHSW